MEKLKVKKIDWGIASRVGDTVYVNKRLMSRPKLKSALINHENAHTDGFTFSDILLDFEMEDLKGLRKEYYDFILHTPSSWVEYLPVKKYGGHILFNPALFLMWLFGGGIISYILISIL